MVGGVAELEWNAKFCAEARDWVDEFLVRVDKSDSVFALLAGVDVLC